VVVVVMMVVLVVVVLEAVAVPQMVVVGVKMLMVMAVVAVVVAVVVFVYKWWDSHLEHRRAPFYDIFSCCRPRSRRNTRCGTHANTALSGAADGEYTIGLRFKRFMS
jgi:hypothetical protein